MSSTQTHRRIVAIPRLAAGATAAGAATVAALLLGATGIKSWLAPARAQDADPYLQGLQWARAVAVPDAMRPRRFVISDYLIGTGATAQPQDLDAGLATLGALGINTAEIKAWGNLTSSIPARAAQAGITHYRRAVYSPLGGHYFSWETEAVNPVAADAWARDQARQISGLGMTPGNTALFHMADEPGWYFPDIIRQFSSTPARLEMFRAFLRGKGLQPADLGAGDWSQVLPITASQLAARNNDLPGRRLFYWTTRFPAESASNAFRVATDALRRNLNPNLLVTTNWNNWVSRYYYPSPNRKIANNKEISPDSAMGMMDWMDVGRKGAVSALWTEDWFNDQDAQLWTYYADAQRSAAQEGGVTFGGDITGRRLGGHPAGGKYRALAMISHGAKAIEYYAYGPEARFPGNCYSSNQAAYGEIADANRLIGRCEDLLYPGQRAGARIAILLPRSASAWDETTTVSIGNMPLYQQEVRGIHAALTHSQYPIDFVDEDTLASGAFANRNYFMIYVTAPNVAAAAQMALANWITNGGTAIFSPGAAAADEYNTPTSILDGVRGVRVAMQPHTGQPVTPLQVTYRDPQFGTALTFPGASTPLQVTTATTVAQFAAGAPAVTTNRAGQGLALCYGFWPGAAYFLSPQRNVPGRLPLNWNAALRTAITAAPRVTRMGRPVDLNIPVVEAARLDSPAGIAVTLLNWSDVPQGQVSVTVHNAGNITSAGSAAQGTVPFTQNGNDITLSLPLRDVDVVMLRH